MRELMRTVLWGRGRQRPGYSALFGWVGVALAGLALLAQLDYFRARRPGTPVSGYARVIDGDSLSVAGREIRLMGIDAPEGRQHCTRGGTDWACGDAARGHLHELIGGATTMCRGEESDRHGRLLAVCEARGRNLNAAMVEDGLAVSYGAYRAEESRARAARRGLWASDFERPRDWRDHHPRH